MREATGQWLEPLMEELSRRNDAATPDDFIDLQRLMMQATMPAAEAGTLMGDWMARSMPAGIGAIDWIRFGGLLRDALGWDWYPEEPN